MAVIIILTLKDYTEEYQLHLKPYLFNKLMVAMLEHKNRTHDQMFPGNFERINLFGLLFASKSLRRCSEEIFENYFVKKR